MRRIVVNQDQNTDAIVEADIELDNTGDAYIHKVIAWLPIRVKPFDITIESKADDDVVAKIWLAYGNELENERIWKAEKRFEDEDHGAKT